MFQEAVKAESPTLSAAGPYLLPAFSLRDRITAAIIREEAAESLLPGILDDAELGALVHVLNSYTTQWWLKHLSCVGADPATYWKAQLGGEIKAATRSERSLSQRKKFSWWFFGWLPARVKYELWDLDLDPL